VFASFLYGENTFNLLSVPLAALCAMCTFDLLSHIPGSFFAAFCGQTIHPTANESEEVNRKLPVRNMMVKLLTLYTDPENYNAQCWTDGWTDRWTDR